MDDDAVSPVIGVILMVAITVVLGAVVFMLVTGMVKSDHKEEHAAARATSPSSGIIHITIVKEGVNAPYVPTAGVHNRYTVNINGIECAESELPASIRAGSVIRLDAAVAGPCQDAIVPGGADHSVTMTVVGTVILSGTVDVRA